MAAITSRTPRATPGRLYGDFSGKTIAIRIYPNSASLVATGLRSATLAGTGLRSATLQRVGLGGATFRPRTS